MNHEKINSHNLKEETIALGLLTLIGFVGTVFTNLAMEVSAGKQILNGPEIVISAVAIGLGSRVVIGLIDRQGRNDPQNNPG
jgi:hypothetical protein